MATVLRAPFYTPRPSDDTYWQGGAPRRSLPLAMLTAAKFFGAGGQVPTKPWRYDFDVGESFWVGQPKGSVTLRALTSGGQPPTKRWRYDYDVGESFWAGQPTPAKTLVPLSPLVNSKVPTKFWRYDYDVGNDAFWLGHPSAALTLSILASGGQVKPRLPWQFGQDDSSFWQGQPSSSKTLSMLVSGGQPPTKRWNYDHDQSSGWQFLGLRNIAIFNSLVVGKPAVNPPWLFGQDDSSYWMGSPVRSTTLLLLTAGGQVKPRLPWRFDQNDDSSFWVGAPRSSALLVPLLTAVGKVPPRWPWSFGLDDPGVWQFLGRKNAVAFNGLVIGNPVFNPPWTFGRDDSSFWKGRPSAALTLAILAAGGQPPTKRWRYDYDQQSDWQFLGRRNSVAFNGIISGNPVFNPPWLFGRDDGSFWPGTPTASQVLRLLTAGGQPPTKRWRYDYDVGESFWAAKPVAPGTVLNIPLGQVPTKLWRYDYDVGESFWAGRPDTSKVLAILAAAGKVKPRWIWNFNLVDEANWLRTPPPNPGLLATLPTLNPFVNVRLTQQQQYFEDVGWVGQPLPGALVLYAPPPFVLVYSATGMVQEYTGTVTVGYSSGSVTIHEV